MYIHFPTFTRARRFGVTVAALAASALAVCADGPPVAVVPILTNGQFGLGWDAQPNATYLIQSASSLDSAAAWDTVDTLSVEASGPVRWMAPESLSGSRFLRLGLPQAAIYAVQPSVGPVSGGTVAYISGQCLSTNGQVRIGGVVIAPEMIVPGATYMIHLPPLPEGVYDVDWLDNGQVAATGYKLFSITAEVQPAGITQRRFDVPELPPAAPLRPAFLSKKGYDYYQAQSGISRVSASGELIRQELDLFVAGRGLDFAWVRTYRSYGSGSSGPAGSRWTHSYDVSIEQQGTAISVQDGTGRSDLYFPDARGIYSRPEFFNEGQFSNGAFVLTFPDTGAWEFNALDGSPTAGKLSRVRDRFGNALGFVYDSAGRLGQVIDTLGRTNLVGYDSTGNLQSVTDFSGRTVTYQYYGGGALGGSPGDLASVTSPPIVGTPTGNDFPDGKTTRYAYSQGFADDRENHLLISVTDPKGQVCASHVYQHNQTDLEFLRCISLQAGTNTPLMLHTVAQVPSPANGFAVLETIANDPLGNVSECFCDSLNRCVLRRAYTGRATPGVVTTESANRPKGKLRPTDPNFFETRWEWNADSLCVREFHPKGDVWSFLYQSDFDSHARPQKRGDLRIIRELACCSGADTDGDGIPDVVVRMWRISHDPRFGAPAMDCRKGWDGTIKGCSRLAIKTKGTGAHFQDLDDDDATVARLAIKTKGTPARFDDLDGDGLEVARRAINTTGTGATVRSFGPELGDPTLDNQPTLEGMRIRPRGWDGTIKGRLEFSSDSLRFTTSFTDPLGSITTGSYDSQGNCVVVHHQGYLLDGSDSPTTSYAFNAFGQIIALTNAPDANGYRRVDTFDYYASGPQAGYCFTWTVDTQAPTLTRTTFEHDARGNVTRCVDPRGFDSLFTYNALDQCVRSASPVHSKSRCLRDFIYDENDNVVQCLTDVRDPNDQLLGRKTHLWTFDGLDRCIAHVEQASSSRFGTNVFVYDANNQVIAALSPEAVNGHQPDNQVTFDYDERGLLLRCTRALGLGGTDEFSYDPNGNLAQRQHHYINLIATRTFGYDGFDRCVQEIDPMGNVCVRAFDVTGSLVYQRFDGETNDVPGSALNQPLGEVRYAYDSLHRLQRGRFSRFDTRTGAPIGNGATTTTFAYAPNGACVAMTDDNGHTTAYAYDTMGRLSQVTRPNNNVVAYSYDACGGVTNKTFSEQSDLGGAAQVFSVSLQLDAFGRLVRCADNTGNATQYGLDSLGNCVRCVDPRGNIRTWQYDYLNRCTVTAADLNGDGLPDIVCSQAWDDNSRLIATTDANTNTTTFTYDSLDRWVLVDRPSGSQARCSYDSHDNIVTNIDANGSVTVCTYDLLDRCIRRDFTPGPGVSGATTFEAYQFDGVSRLVAANNDVSAFSFGWDSASHCLSASDGTFSVGAAYDGVGNRLSVSYPDGAQVSYTYDALNQVSSLSRMAGGRLAQLATFSYDGPGRLARITRLNGINTRQVWDGLSNPANTAGDFGWRQVSGVNQQRAQGGPVIDRRSYAYDADQNKILREELTPIFPGAALETNVFGYDAANRLRVTINNKGSFVRESDYTLDGNGNRQSVTNNGSPEFYQMVSALPPGDFQENQYSFTPFGSQQFDHNGNLVARNGSDGQFSFVYDCLDRLVQVTSFGGGALAPVVSFTYDALGRRISKTTYPPAPAAPVTTQFIYDVEDCDDRDPCVIARAQFGTMIDSMLNIQDDRRTIAIVTATGETFYPHCDELGNALALTDSSGNVVERYAYDDYGQPTFLSSDGVPLVDGSGLPLTESPHGNAFLFHSMMWDGESGMYCKEFSPAEDQLKGNPRHRLVYVDPKNGRTISRTDCVSLGGSRVFGQNSFTFAGENPWSGGGGGGGGGAGGMAARVKFSRDSLKGTTKTQGDFNLAHRFSVEIDGVMVAGVHTIDGLESETDVVEYKDGEDGTSHTRPGNHKPGKMVVTKDWSNTSEWYNWRKAVLDGKVDRKSVSVIFHNDAGEEAGRMNFYQCWPTKYVGPALNARNSAHATEKIEVVYETFGMK